MKVLKQKKESKRNKSTARGVVALELAILLPVLLLLIMGILEFGYAFFVDLTLTNAVREGARVGITLETETEMVTVAELKVTSYVNDVLGSQFSAALDTSEISFNADTNELEVAATITGYPELSPIRVLSDTLLPSNIRARAVMRWELAGANN